MSNTVLPFKNPKASEEAAVKKADSLKAETHARFIMMRRSAEDASQPYSQDQFEKLGRKLWEMFGESCHEKTLEIAKERNISYEAAALALQCRLFNTTTM